MFWKLKSTFYFIRITGVSDHYANNDNHALHITKTIIANLGNNKKLNLENNIDIPVPPLYPIEELYGIVGDNLKKNYDVREVKIISKNDFHKS